MNGFIIATRLGDSYKYSKSFGSSHIGFFLLMSGLILLLSIGWYYWFQQKEKKLKQAVKKKKVSLFQELCHLHKITVVEKKLLQQAIHANSLKQSALAFLDPVILSQQAEKSETNTDQWIRLKEKLFGSD
ncbi:hypothetical protein MNBD_PLANCTO02-2615 [hydrothermal vent metagenome]|uniref:Uncharacterized protein n=1 Tax=hydrothermal vent metagenome TaxID=652676 RepID=A0A3B1DQ88_9ZZZZ